MAKQIPLTRGQYALVDDDDFERISQSKWYCKADGYAARKDWSTGEPKQVYMHRQILNAPDGVMVDHINANRLDNRRSNLRLVNSIQNSRRQSPMKGTTSEYKGVSFYQDQWYVRIHVDGKSRYYGRYREEKLAARVYDYAASKHYGEYARINFPDELMTDAEFAEVDTRRQSTSSEYRGVCWDKKRQAWIAHITVRGRFKYLGRFEDEVEAAKAYNEAAIQYHSDSAVLNSIPTENIQ